MNEFDDPIYSALTIYSIAANAPLELALAVVPETAEYLDCEDCPLPTLACLRAFTNLRILNISSTRLSSLHGIGRFRRLEILFADFGEFQTLEPLAAITTLRSLDLTCSQVNACDVSPLRGLHRLERLYLAHSPVRSIAPLMQLQSLRLLSLAGTLVPAEEVARFRNVHPQCELWT
jgi:internalin A